MGSALKWIGATTFFIALAMPVAPGQDKVPELSPAQDNPSFKFSVGTHLVLVPVVVNDKQGKHVPGLTAADFEIKEDGNVKKLASFEEITAENTVAERPVLPPKTFTNQVVAARPKKLEIILLDLLNTPLSGRAEARRGLIDFLSKSADPDTLTALLVLRSNRVTMIHNFTSDPSVLMAAIRKLQGQATSRDTPTMNTNGGDVDAEARQTGNHIRRVRGIRVDRYTHRGATKSHDSWAGGPGGCVPTESGRPDNAGMYGADIPVLRCCSRAEIAALGINRFQVQSGQHGGSHSWDNTG